MAMQRHRSSAVPLVWLYAALIVYASLYPFAGWRVPGRRSARLPDRSASRCWTWFDLISNLLGYLPLGFLLFVALVRSGRRAGAAAWTALLGGTMLSFAHRAAAELPAAPRLLEPRPAAQRAGHGARHRHRPAARRPRRDRALADGCATAGSSPAAPAAWRCCCSGRSACSFRPRCRSASATCSAGCSRSSPSCCRARRPRAGPRAGPTLPQRAAESATLSAASELAIIVLGLLAPCLVAFTIAVPGWRRQRAGHRRGAARRRRDDALDRAQLRPAARLRLDHGAGGPGPARRPGRGGAAEPGAATGRRRLRPDHADRAGHAGRSRARRSVLRAEPAVLGAGPLHPLPRRGAVGRLDLAVRRALLPAGAAGGARAAAADGEPRLSRPGRAAAAPRRWVRDAGLGELVQHVHVVPARHRLADRHRGRSPGLGDQRVLAQELLALVAADERRTAAASAPAWAIGLRRAAAAASSRRSGARKGAWRSGSSSNTPESDERALHQVGRQLGFDARASRRRASSPPGARPPNARQRRCARGSPPMRRRMAPDPGQRLPAAGARSRSMLAAGQSA